MPRSALIAGSATFTTVLSIMIMKRAKHSAPSVHHLRFSSAKIFARTRPPCSRKLACTRLARTSQSVKAYACPRGGDLASGGSDPRAHERAAARAQARLRRLRLAGALLAGRAGALLARSDRRHAARVLASLGRGSRRVARAGVGDLVRRRPAQPGLELRPPLGARRAGRRAGRGLAERGRPAALAHLPRALGGGDK